MEQGAHAQRVGQPLRIPTTQPGRFIARRLAAIGLTQSALAGRLGVDRTTVWRLMHRKTGFTSSVAPGALCAALELEGSQRDRLLRLLRAAPAGMPVPVDVPVEATESGTASPSLQLRAFLRRHLTAARLTQDAFAARIGVRPSTVSRLLSGKSGRTHHIQPDRVVSALELDDGSRQTFLWLAFHAGLFAVTPQAARPLGPLLRMEHALGCTLAEVGPRVDDLAARRNRGEVAEAYAGAQRLFTRLYDDISPTTVGYASPEAAQARLRVGFEYSQALAARLPWYGRQPRMIALLNRVEGEVLQYFPENMFASEWGHLINLRAPLYRDLRGPLPPAAEYQRTIAELTRGIEHSISPRAEPTLYVELLRNRAHTHLYAGDAHGWRRDLESAERLADTLRGDEGEQFQALVTYSWGEGFVRLAGEAAPAGRERAYYAREAMACLEAGERVFRQYVPWHGYALLAGTALARCLGWSAPDEAQRHLRRLHLEAASIYPAMTAKIARVARTLGGDEVPQ
jgi:transcriptional regulator with XRE-family HTH domain